MLPAYATVSPGRIPRPHSVKLARQFLEKRPKQGAVVSAKLVKGRPVPPAYNHPLRTYGKNGKPVLNTASTEQDVSKLPHYGHFYLALMCVRKKFANFLLIAACSGYSIRSEFTELGSIHAREAVGGGAEQVIPSIPVEDWNAAAELLEGFAHVL